MNTKPKTSRPELDQLRKTVYSCWPILIFVVLFFVVIYQSDQPKSNPTAENNARAYIERAYAGRCDFMSSVWIPDTKKNGWPDASHIVVTVGITNPITRNPDIAYIRLGCDEQGNVIRDIDGINFTRPY